MNSQANIELIADEVVKVINTLLETSPSKWPKREDIIHRILEIIIDIGFKDTISDYIVDKNSHIVYLHKHKQIIVFKINFYLLPTYTYLKNISIKLVNGICIYTDKETKSQCRDFRELIIFELPHTIKKIKEQCTKKK